MALGKKKNENIVDNSLMNCLTIIETEKGVWTACSAEVFANEEGTLFNASEICSRLSLTLSEEGRKLLIKKSDACYNVYTNGNAEFTFCQGGTGVKRIAPLPAVFGRKEVTRISPGSLSTLCNFITFSGGRVRATAYAGYGYEVIYAISLVGMIKNLPQIGLVNTENGEPLEKRLAKDRTFRKWMIYSKKAEPEPEPEKPTEPEKPAFIQPEYFTLFGGRRIRRAHEFRVPDKELYWPEDNDLLYVEKEGMKGFVENGCGVLLINSNIYFNLSGDYRVPCIKLSAVENEYHIELHSGLGYTISEKRLGKKDYSEIKCGILRLMLYKISSEPEQIFNAISAAEADNSLLKEPEEVGDCIIKRIKNNKVNTYVLSAKPI